MTRGERTAGRAVRHRAGSARRQRRDLRIAERVTTMPAPFLAWTPSTKSLPTSPVSLTTTCTQRPVGNASDATMLCSPK
jgi:hypothetical protein